MGVYGQLAALMAGGMGIGYVISKKIGPTELPQSVAAFHSLVGIAATATAIGDFLLHDFAHFGGFHCGALYMGAWMGAITATGSVVAWGKLSERMNSDALALPGRDAINIGLG